MSNASVNCPWKEVASRLRPFVARRVATLRDVDDVMQEICIRVHRGLQGLEHHERFGPWIHQVARSAIADYWRTRSRQPLVTEDIDAAEVLQANEDNFVESHLADYVAPLVALLPTPYREALTLTELEGLSQKEAADMLGVSVTAMKSRVQRGRQKLRELFEVCCEFALDARGHVISCCPKVEGPDPCQKSD